MSGRELTDRDIRWTLDGPAPWPPTRAVLDVALEVLPVVADETAGDVIEQMMVTLADLRDELRAVRAVLSSALTLVHAQHTEIRRLRQRLAALLDARRPERTAA